MKKLLVLFILCMSLPCFASEQSVLNEARIMYKTVVKNDVNTLPQADKDLVGLIYLYPKYISTFNGEELVNLGNVIIKCLPNAKNPNKESAEILAYSAISVGNAFKFNFTEARKALNQLSKFNGKVIDGSDCTANYNKIKTLVNTIETSYNRAKANGYMSEEQLKNTIKSQLGI